MKQGIAECVSTAAPCQQEVPFQWCPRLHTSLGCLKKTHPLPIVVCVCVEEANKRGQLLTEMLKRMEMSLIM